jgi:CHAT domain-containing protein
MTRARIVVLLALGLAAGTWSRPRDGPKVGPPAPVLEPTAVAPAAPGSTTDLDSVIDRGESAYLRGEFDSARAVWNGTLARALVNHDSARQGRSLTWLGLAAYRLGEYARARSLGEQALSLKLRAGLAGDLSVSYNALGLLAWNQGRLTEATALFDQASVTARAAADEKGLAKAANNLALVHTELGNFAEARAGFLQARRSARQLGDARIEGGALTNLGMLDVQMGDPRSAIVSLRAGQALYRSIDYETGEQNTLGQLGTAYDAMGEPRLALAALDSALEISRKEGLKQEEASNLELIGGLFRQAGDPRRALEFYHQANQLDAELGLVVEQGNNLRSEAEIHSVLGRPDLARDLATRALRIHRQAGARLQELRDRILLADFASAAGSRSEASGHLQAAGQLAVTLDARIARAEVAIGKATLAERTGNARGALRVLAASRNDLSGGDYGTAWQAATLRTRAYARLSLLDSAAAAGREAVAAVERVRGNFGSGFLRASYAVDKGAAYADLVGVLLRLGQTAEAFEVADAGRSRSLLEHLGAGGREGPRSAQTIRAFGEGEVLLRRIDTLVSRLNLLEETPRGERDSSVLAQMGQLAADLNQARETYEANLIRITEGDAAGAALLGGRKTSLAEVQHALQPTEAVVEYFVTAERVIAFVVTREAVRSHISEISLDQLSPRVRLARDLLGDPSSSGGGAEVLGALHQALIRPLERAGALLGVRRLIIVPHSLLAYVPFAALKNAASGHYLVEDYVLLQLPSAAALGVVRNRTDASGVDREGAGRPSVLVPYPRALPGSLREARAFRRTVRGAEIYQGSSATEGTMREALARGSMVHVATHGVMNPRNPMFSRIELARIGDEPGDDGRLEVHELLGLRIDAPLVFLSGCETGLGAAWATQFDQGEDYATLAQAFLYAGARNVMATLWRIQDEGAGAFAERFYAHIALMPPPDALAKAQRELLQSSKYAAPHYWAPYQMSGDGQPSGPHNFGRLSVQYR